MKIFMALLFTCISLSGFGQDLKKITHTFSVPSGWKGQLVKDSSYIPMYGKKTIARWVFVCKTKRIEPIEFLIFDYLPQDSAAMEQKAMMYYATSNCLVVSNEDIRQNSMNFVKGNYYFAEKMCPCYTTGTEECRTIVRKLGDWIKSKEKTKEF